MGRCLKAAGLLAVALTGWLALPQDRSIIKRSANTALALDMDLRRPMFSQPAGSRRGQRPAPPSPDARGQGYRRAPAAPQQRGIFDSLFGAPQPPQYQPGYRALPAPSAQRPSPQRPKRRAPPPVVARSAVQQTEFVYVMAAPRAASEALEMDLEAVLADRPAIGVKALPLDRDDAPVAAQLLGAAPDALAPDGKSAVVVIAATPAWQQLDAAQMTRLVAEVSAGMAMRRAPVIWVGLPPVADRETSARYAAVNGALRAAADKAGGGFVDAWAVFADDGGGFAAWGPAVNGEITRLRADDGVALTRAGRRKLAHFIMVEVRKVQARWLEQVAAKAVAAIDPFSLPGPQLSGPHLPATAPQTAKPVVVRKPDAGPVLPLNAGRSEPSGQLAALDGQRPELTDAVTRSALRDGTPPPALAGRADDFRWPRSGE